MEGEHMKRSDWLLVLLYLPGHTGQENEPMDRLRIVKALFLCGKEIKGLHNFYDFSPYLYGPFSLDIYRDLDQLLTDGYIRREITLPLNWSRYWLTGKGSEEAQKIHQEIEPSMIKKMQEIKRIVTGLPFLALLKHVYSKYPEYAKDSVINVS
jgi:uncharacterized protein YwgA